MTCLIARSRWFESTKSTHVIRADNSVARHEKRQRIARHSVRSSSVCCGPSCGRGKPRIRSRFSSRNLNCRTPTRCQKRRFFRQPRSNSLWIRILPFTPGTNECLQFNCPLRSRRRNFLTFRMVLPPSAGASCVGFDDEHCSCDLNEKSLQPLHNTSMRSGTLC